MCQHRPTFSSLFYKNEFHPFVSVCACAGGKTTHLRVPSLSFSSRSLSSLSFSQFRHITLTACVCVISCVRARTDGRTSSNTDGRDKRRRLFPSAIVCELRTSSVARSFVGGCLRSRSCDFVKVISQVHTGRKSVE